MDKSSGKTKKILSNQQGMALLITVMTVSLLLAVTLMFHRTSWQSYVVADGYKVNTQLKAIGESGINIGLALLLEDADKNGYDSLLDGWAVLEKDDLNSLFDSGQLELSIVDLSGRLQINSLVQENEKGGGQQEGQQGEENSAQEISDILLQLLLSPVFAMEEESEAQSIVDSLVDWIDKDERESDNGAESSFYQALKKPYGSRNGPVVYIEELLLVKGITPLLLFGEGERKGLADYITVHGDDGKININTAETLLIKSLNPLIDDELIEKLHTYRTDEENEGQLGNPQWYSRVESWPGDIVLNQKLLATKSSFFLVRATGESESLSRTVTAVVNRVDKKTIKVLSRKVN